MTKRAIPVLERERVRLRLLTVEDLPLTLLWRNQDAVRRWFFHSDLLSPEQHRAWFESYCNRDDDFVFIIEEIVKLNVPVGQIALYDIDWDRRKAEFGRLMIGELRARGMGLAKEATQLLLYFAHQEWRLREIFLEVYENNLPALAIYRTCGFTETQRHSGIVTMVWRPVSEAN